MPTLKNHTRWTIIKTHLKHREFFNAWRTLWNGSSSFDTMNGDPFWTFKKGIGYDYTNMEVVVEPLPEKPEGAPVAQGLKEIGAEPIGHWWSVQFRCGKFLVRFRYRSYDTNIFYMTWGT